jgi:hypothetical protein
MTPYYVKYLSLDQSSINKIVITANTKLEALNQVPDHYRLIEFIVETAE